MLEGMPNDGELCTLMGRANDVCVRRQGKMPQVAKRNPQTVAFLEMLSLPYNLDPAGIAAAIADSLAGQPPLRLTVLCVVVPCMALWSGILAFPAPSNDANCAQGSACTPGFNLSIPSQDSLHCADGRSFIDGPSTGHLPLPSKYYMCLSPLQLSVRKGHLPCIVTEHTGRAYVGDLL